VKDFQYNNKVDIWALGCILYELAFRKKAFDSDMAVLSHALSKQRLELPSGPMRFGQSEERKLGVFGFPNQALNSVVCKMLDLEHSKRPTARQLCEMFNTNFWSSESDPCLKPSSIRQNESNNSSSDRTLILRGSEPDENVIGSV